jgi:hypothetical protein
MKAVKSDSDPVWGAVPPQEGGFPPGSVLTVFCFPPLAVPLTTERACMGCEGENTGLSTPDSVPSSLSARD